MGELHDADVLAWSERQARLLQQHAAGEPGNEVPDWANIIGKVERCGKDQLHAAEQLLTQALAQMLKAYAWPLHREVPFWQAEARRLRDDATACTTLSMRPRIDFARVVCRCAVSPSREDGNPRVPAHTQDLPGHAGGTAGKRAVTSGHAVG